MWKLFDEDSVNSISGSFSDEPNVDESETDETGKKEEDSIDDVEKEGM